MLILPNPTPARISQNAKTAILDLLAQFGGRKLNLDKLRADADAFTRLTVAHRCVIWVHFHKLRYDEGLKKLTTLLGQIPKPEDLDGLA